jgi:hypothetical protein
MAGQPEVIRFISHEAPAGDPSVVRLPRTKSRARDCERERNRIPTLCFAKHGAPGMGQRRGIAWAIGDVFTVANLEIAAVAALIGYVLFEFLRKKF